MKCRLMGKSVRVGSVPRHKHDIVIVTTMSSTIVCGKSGQNYSIK